MKQKSYQLEAQNAEVLVLMKKHLSIGEYCNVYNGNNSYRTNWRVSYLRIRRGVIIKTQNLYKKIIANVELHDILNEFFDFELIEPNLNTEDYFFKVDDKATIIAQDASGGIFALIGKGEPEILPVIYISSEGQTGKVGKNFEEFFSLMITCPFWSDLLKFSGNGQVSEMKKAFLLLNDELLEDFPEIESVKEKIISTVTFHKISNPVETLFHAMISEPNLTVFSLEGDKFDSLFNSFVVTDNPLWKNKI